MKKNALIIFNGLKKKNYFTNNLGELIDYLSKNNYTVEIYATQSKRDCTRKISVASKLDLLVVSGGDGTINEAVNALAILDYEVNVLYFPTGTVNDFAYSLGLKKSIKDGIELIENNKLITVDSARINDHFFNYVTAFGPFTKGSYLADNELKKKLGPLAYIISSLNDVLAISKSYKMDLIINDEERISDDYILGLIVNSTSVAGFRFLFANNDLNDGLFEVLFINKNYDIIPKSMINILTKGIDSSLNPDKFLYRKIHKLEVICSDDVHWTVDGEEGPIGSVVIEVIDKKLNIYANIT